MESMDTEVGIVETDLVPREPQNVLRAIQEISSRPGLDPAVLHSMLDLQERVMAREAEAEYTRDMIALKEELPKITKTGRIVYAAKPGQQATSIPYARYEDISKIIKPLLSKYGFSLSFTSDIFPNPPKLLVHLTIKHRGGHSEKFSSMPLPVIDSSGGKTDVQGAGSSFAYGKRYVLTGALDIVTEGEDDDGSGQNMQCVDRDQLYAIERRISEYGVDEPKFLKLLNAPTVEEILQKDYKRAIDLLEQKRRQSEARK